MLVACLRHFVALFITLDIYDAVLLPDSLRHRISIIRWAHVFDTSLLGYKLITISCAHAPISSALIQALCRWRSLKSIDIYARLGPTDYTRYVLDIERQAVDAVTAKRIHETRFDWDSIVAALDGPVIAASDAE